MPFIYQLYLWRRKMNVGWFEAMQTPYEVIMQDLGIMELEGEYLHKQPEAPKKQKGLSYGVPNQ